MLTENPTILSKIHFHIADALMNKQEFINAIENYNTALEYDSSSVDFVIMTHNSIGTSYR